ncbi:hypothetical protein [Candidatus Sodalis pierantonius]|uniref:family 4 glycosyl hydrolase n=1 Tax=Candidatus Sodalis pierantonii TaxID=1486991 RepID=UPI001F274A69|nr:hypothetical protein [Candidatus Sodalis pierantonius]
MSKITLIGAGSTGFAQNILSNPKFGYCTINLQDIDSDRLRTSEIVTRRICEALSLPDVKVEATLDRRAALKGAHFVFLMMQVGGYRPSTVINFEIPTRFGLRQTIGDTLGIDGIFRALRTIPVIKSICDDMAELCPDALLLNYVNPMAINCWAISALAPQINMVGLCHSM